MIIKDAKNLPQSENPHGVKTSVLFNTKDAMAVHIDLEPGEKLKRHITPVDVFFYILEGNPEIEIGDERMEVGRDHLVESPAGIVHCIYNPGKEKARILVVKVPRPEKSTKIL